MSYSAAVISAGEVVDVITESPPETELEEEDEQEESDTDDVPVDEESSPTAEASAVESESVSSWVDEAETVTASPESDDAVNVSDEQIVSNKEESVISESLPEGVEEISEDFEGWTLYKFGGTTNTMSNVNDNQ